MACTSASFSTARLPEPTRTSPSRRHFNTADQGIVLVNSTADGAGSLVSITGNEIGSGNLFCATNGVGQCPALPPGFTLGVNRANEVSLVEYKTGTIGLPR